MLCLMIKDIRMYKQDNQLICSKRATGESKPPKHVVNKVNDLDTLVISD